MGNLNRREEISKELDRLLRSFTETVKRAQESAHQAVIFHALRERNPLGIDGVKRWLKNEPDFPKPIVSSLGHQTIGNSSKRTPERYQRI